MVATSSDLVPPVLLMAMPQVLDPFFQRSVVLLVHHDDEGSIGFVVNRSTGIKVSEILKGLEVGWQGDEEAVAFFGGPVQPQVGTVIFAPEALSAEQREATTDVMPGMSLTQHVGDLSRLAATPPEHFRLILGYAGWGAGQLIEEILRNDWLTAPADSDLIFIPDTERIWEEALRSVGVDPAALPSWTPVSAGGEETAN